MSYKIAAATSDELHIDLSFRETDAFTIIDVKDDGSYSILEKREVQQCHEDEGRASKETVSKDITSNETIPKEDGSKEDTDVEEKYKSGCGIGCGSGCSGSGGNHGGCGNGHSDADIEARVKIISDCRCLVCRKIGPGAERQLEKKAITSFQIDIGLEEALRKITQYYTKIDNHISLRNRR